MQLHLKVKTTTLLKLVLTFLFVFLCTAKAENDITVHIIPHTHDDAGWLWTLEQYYSGTGGARVSVKNILDSFVDSLYHNQERTFTYVEMAFFIKWYKTQSEIVKNKVKELISQKRFEFINGGYVMHDEAASYYQHSIDQMRLGLLFLKQEFDYVPEVAWFIDPFGHSASNAYILAKMGFKKIVLVRIDYKEKDARKAQKSLEFYWVPFGQIDSNTRIFTHITHDHYNPPAGMEDFISDAALSLSEDNLRNRASKLLESIKDINSKYRTKHHLLMYGDDFTHNKADANFLNIEKLMKYVNEKDMGMKLIYSTPTKYFEKIFEQVNDWPLFENQDFFPYADGEYAYWTGYFTSRPYLKGVIRDAGNYLVTVSKELFEVIANAKKSKKYESLKDLIHTNIEMLFSLREYLAICQHHDAVSGTARELVSEDYIEMLTRSLNDSKEQYHKLIQIYQQLGNAKLCMDPVVDIKCQENIYKFKADKKYSLKVNNGKGTGNATSGISVLNNFYFDKSYHIVTKSDLNEQNDESEIFCVDQKKDKTAFCQVYFHNQNKFLISKESKIQKIKKFLHKEILEKPTEENIKTIINNKKYFSNPSKGSVDYQITKNLKLTISSDKFFFELSTQQNSKEQEKSYKFEAFHAYYYTYDGYNSDLRPENSNPGGAYILSTTELNYRKFILDYERSYFEVGSKITKLVLRFERSFMIITFANEGRGTNALQIESVWDPIDTNDRNPKEYLLVVKTDIDNTVTLPDGSVQPEFWTDSNGIKMMRRIKDFRASYNYKVTEKLASNFYPVNAMFSLFERNKQKYAEENFKDFNYEARKVTLLNDRAQSGGAMEAGEIITIHNRHSNRDDRRGLADGIYEKDSCGSNFRVNNYLVFGNNVDSLKDIEAVIQERFGVLYWEGDNEAKDVADKILINNFVAGLESKNLIYNIHLITGDKLFLQLFNNCDNYFEKECQTLFLNFVQLEDLSYNVTEYGMNGTTPLEKLNMQESHKIELKPFDFKLFMIEF